MTKKCRSVVDKVIVDQRSNQSASFPFYWHRAKNLLIDNMACFSDCPFHMVWEYCSIIDRDIELNGKFYHSSFMKPNG